MIICDNCMKNQADLGTMYIELAGVRQGVDICRECFKKLFSDLDEVKKAFCVQVKFDDDERGSIEEKLLAEKNREMLKGVATWTDATIMPEFTPDTVITGNQVWMAYNLQLDDGGEGIFHNPDNHETYYTYDAAKRIADKLHGWHLPNIEEWDRMIRDANAADDAGKLLASGSNTSGLSITLVGSRGAEGDFKSAKTLSGVDIGYNEFYEVGRTARFWTSVENDDDPECAWYRYFDRGPHNAMVFTGPKSSGLSVRLVMDN